MPSGPNYIALAVPFFFLLMGVELLIARRRGRRLYRLADALNDLACGVTQQVSLVFTTAILLGGYVFVYEHYRVVTFAPGSALPWLLAFFGVDFLYYWWHRLSHEVNFLWAAHIVHHQSEDFNLAVALRQAIGTSWTAWPFYIGLAALGVPPLVYVAIQSFNLLYQFWIHTELIGLTPRFDRVLNSPSLHRVHHAINPRYLDRNYGGTLTIWDRLFGTFEPEVEAPVYGITKPLASFNPMWAQVHYWLDLARTTSDAPHFADKLRVWWQRPAWRPAGLAPSPPPSDVTPASFLKYDPAPPRRLLAYVALQFVLALAVAVLLMVFGTGMPVATRVALAAFVLATLTTCGALLERRSWALPAELCRITLIAAGLLGFAHADLLPVYAAGAGTVGAAALATWLMARRGALAPP
ncbi:MAG: fatty acid hydroxylase family protein [Myxococcales bacterium]|nr:fatty acid hydroxylase family protein [Myxococcales bacterium]